MYIISIHHRWYQPPMSHRAWFSCSCSPPPAGRAPLVLWCHQQPPPAGRLRLSQGDVVLVQSSLMCSLWWKQDVKHRMGVAIAFIAVLKVILLKSYYHVFWTGAKNVNVGPQ